MNILKIALPLVLITSLFSCDTKSGEKTSDSKLSDSAKKANDTTLVELKFDRTYDNVARYISGFPQDTGSALASLDTTDSWKKFSQSFDSAWIMLEELRFKSMHQWTKEELSGVNQNNKHLFYPFSGPDFLNAHIFFPNANTYTLIGLEPIGSLPDISKFNNKGREQYLNSVKFSLNDLFKKSYFITKNMLNDLSQNKVNGTTPLMCVFLKRTGHTIVNITNVGVDSLGAIVPRNDTIPFKGSKGVQIKFVANGSKVIKTLYYFKTDLSDAGLKANAGFTNYLNKLDTIHTYLKAASHLLHYGSFSTVRNILLAKSDCVLQDDSGISYKFFNDSIWNIKLYGDYAKAVKDFAGVNQPELRKAYDADSTIKPLPFSLGYHWGTKEVNLMLATKK